MNAIVEENRKLRSIIHKMKKRTKIQTLKMDFVEKYFKIMMDGDFSEFDSDSFEEKRARQPNAARKCWNAMLQSGNESPIFNKSKLSSTKFYREQSNPLTDITDISSIFVTSTFNGNGEFFNPPIASPPSFNSSLLTDDNSNLSLGAVSPVPSNVSLPSTSSDDNMYATPQTTLSPDPIYYEMNDSVDDDIVRDMSQNITPMLPTHLFTQNIGSLGNVFASRFIDRPAQKSIFLEPDVAFNMSKQTLIPTVTHNVSSLSSGRECNASPDSTMPSDTIVDAIAHNIPSHIPIDETIQKQLELSLSNELSASYYQNYTSVYNTPYVTGLVSFFAKKNACEFSISELLDDGPERNDCTCCLCKLNKRIGESKAFCIRDHPLEKTCNEGKPNQKVTQQTYISRKVCDECISCLLLKSKMNETRKFRCFFESCTETRCTRVGLKNHYFKHLGVRNFNCGLCKQDFYGKSALKQHERKHAK